MNSPATRSGKIAAFIFQWLYENRYIAPRSITVGYVYDDELDFLEAFMTAFPGRDRTDYDAAKRRLATHLNRLHQDGWLTKRQRYNGQQYIGEMRSGFYPTFSLPASFAARIDSGFWNANAMGRKYQG